MKIRTKLILSYITLLSIISLASYISFQSIKSWDKTAADLQLVQEKSTAIEQIRTLMYRQISLGREYIDDNSVSVERIAEVSQKLDKEMEGYKSYPLTELELIHFEALSETSVELSWVITSIIDIKQQDGKEFNATKARLRLSEIVDEISDDILVLLQFYQNHVTVSIDNSRMAGNRTVVVITFSVLLVMVLLLFLFIFNQRWLFRPIGQVSKVTHKISKGNFLARFESVPNDEWGELAASINAMARSLQEYESIFRSQERILALGEVAAYTAHNLQNPLAGIRAAIQYLQGKNDDIEVQEYYNDILGSIDRLNVWIKRFLEFAKPMQLVKTTSFINNSLDTAIQINKKKLDKNSVLIERVQNSKSSIKADHILLEQVYSVFINNAIEADSKTIKIVSSEIIDKDGILIVNVVFEDDGTGLSERVKKKLFQAFVSTKENGTGLGLAQAKKVIDLHGGTLSIEDREIKGTRVIVSLPQLNE